MIKKNPKKSWICAGFPFSIVLWGLIAELSSYPEYFQATHWLSMGLLEIFRVTLTGMGKSPAGHRWGWYHGTLPSLLSHCSSFEDLVDVDEIRRYRVFKWVAKTGSHIGYQPSSTDNGHQNDMLHYGSFPPSPWASICKGRRLTPAAVIMISVYM